MTVLVQPAAVVDASTLAAYYENRAPGLGDRVLATFERVLGQDERPRSFPVHIGRFRRAAMAPFPVAVFFTERDAATIDVVAVFDLRRDPASIRESLSGRGRSQ